MAYDITGKRVFVAGHSGMVGSALVRRFEQEDCTILTRTRSELDLLDQAAVMEWLKQEKPDVVIIAAGKSGGSIANRDRPVEFMYENLAIGMHLVRGAYEAGVGKLVNIAAPHIYPAMAYVPTNEQTMMSGPLHDSYKSSAMARLAVLKLCEFYHQQYNANFTTVIPAEIYGPGDNFDRLSGRVMPAFIREAEEAKQAKAPYMILRGYSTAVREFIYVDDFADAVVAVIKRQKGCYPVNIGAGFSITLRELVYKVADIVEFEGQVKFLQKMPAGVAERFLTSTKARFLGWQPKYSLEEGIHKTWQAFLQGRYREYDLKLFG
ncbi:NAD-dependent epimerase/dehydratase family protein [Thalassospira sp.]|uniref:NAD-dependent epimerase/dehydratase family protein n=1 Tax=Thalassospira sp. TaxID=1912094 RepID=UPI003AA84AA1